MFRPMKYPDTAMSDEEIEQALEEENWGVLSVIGDDGYPYGVPMNYVWYQGMILLHATARNSHRLDALTKETKVSFTVVPEHTLDQANWGEIFRSVIIFGEAEVITGNEEKAKLMHAFMKALAPVQEEEALQKCPPTTDALCMILIHPSQITGKKVENL